MTDEPDGDEIYISNRATRRIVVSDDLPVVRDEVRGRRLEDPPEDVVAVVERAKPKSKVSPKFLGALLGGVVLIAAIAVFAVKALNTRKVSKPPVVGTKTVAREQPAAVPTEHNELNRIDELAKQVVRRISRDPKPYSFSDTSLREIQTRVNELSRSSQLAEAMIQLDSKRDAIASSAAKEGLQPSLVMLLGLALTRGGESGDCVHAAKTSLPLLASLNKTFGSNEVDSCLILIAAFRGGPGTRRSHPLLRTMNQVVTNPLTERNVWFLNQQAILSADAYELVIDTIAFGIIARSPR
ncbi:MAG TPA: hypothetical protein VJS17_00685, partial [Pyrinomonadaceae bacterium]|nr:hypothetical protein [Pyrinomonadaceae bacterium]